MKLLTRTTATGLLALGLSVSTATAAFAHNDPGPLPAPQSESIPSASKTRCTKAIERRVLDLAKWTVKINFNQNLTVAQKAQLVGIMTTTSANLQSVALPAVQGATTKADLKTACQKIATDYRVYLVVHPQVFLCAQSESWLTRVADLQAQALVLHNAGKNTTVIDALLLDASNVASPICGNVLAVTPASYNADPAGTRLLFNHAKGDLRTVEQDVHQAAKMIKKLNKKH